MLNKILNSLVPAKFMPQKSAKGLVNIVSESPNLNKSEEMEVLSQAKGVIENFARKNNIQVDMFLKEAKNDYNVNEQIVDIKVKNRKNDALAEKIVVYKINDKPAKFTVIKNNIRYVKAEDREYVQTLPSAPMKITVFDTVNKKVTPHELKLPDIKIKIKEYNNYEIPKIIGTSEYEDSFLRYVYRTIGQLKNHVLSKSL